MRALIRDKSDTDNHTADHIKGSGRAGYTTVFLNEGDQISAAARLFRAKTGVIPASDINANFSGEAGKTFDAEFYRTDKKSWGGITTSSIRMYCKTNAARSVTVIKTIWPDHTVKHMA